MMREISGYQMNDRQLDRNLRSIGKECFVTFFYKFYDSSLSNEDVSIHIKEERGHYTDKSCRSRTSHARSIIKAGRALDALDVIRSSASSQVKAHTKERAAELAAYLRESVAALPQAHNVELTAALNDLQESKSEAHEVGYPIPSDKVLENSERLLKAMYRISPRRYEVYPTPDGEIAIDAPGGYNRSVLLLCDSQGGVLCLVNMNGNHRRARYSSSERLPDGFVREALADLESKAG